MIRYLKYVFTFANGKTIKQDIQLQAGSTLINGANGKGKSLTFEVISYLLFGNKALRGVATDYKKIKAEMSVEINAKPYVITRTKTQAEVICDGEVCVSGVAAVNSFITRIMGYGYDVFKIAHWCGQGEIQALAAMRPTERKAMIDSVAGLASMDALTKIIADQIREGKASIGYLTGHLIAPVTPVTPSVKKELALQALDEIDKLQATYQRLMQVQPVVIPIEPVAPLEPDFPDAPKPFELPELSATTPEIPEGLPASTSQLNTIIAALEAEKTKYDRLIRELASFPVYEEKSLPTLTDYVDEASLKKAWASFHRFQFIEDFKASSNIHCPNCEHVFHLSDEVQKLINTDAGSSVKPTIELGIYREAKKQLADEVKISQLTKDLEALNGDKVVAMLEVARIALKMLKLYDEEVLQYKSKRKNLDEMYKTQTQGHLTNIERIRKHYDAQMVHHNKRLGVYESEMATLAERLDIYNAAKMQLANLPIAANDINGHTIEVRTRMSQILIEWAKYETEETHYESLCIKYDAAKAELTLLTNKNAQLELAKKAVKEVKSRVQSHLIPSLNNVASSLMNEMTGGEYTSVVVGESFEVEVDGQPLRTLSGSAKDLANLTLRIALGRIITHRVMGFMLLDEIDSAMDDTRASYTWDCIERITPQIGQVIQASHKDLSSDNTINV
jgi:DNA repair exonuclease SbcCD ATPase subunit